MEQQAATKGAQNSANAAGPGFLRADRRPDFGAAEALAHKECADIRRPHQRERPHRDFVTKIQLPQEHQRHRRQPRIEQPERQPHRLRADRQNAGHQHKDEQHRDRRPRKRGLRGQQQQRHGDRRLGQTAFIALLHQIGPLAHHQNGTERHQRPEIQAAQPDIAQRQHDERQAHGGPANQFPLEVRADGGGQTHRPPKRRSRAA